jgi:FtsP/CotA-like multicopper oxidase with cupredoxin domain
MFCEGMIMYLPFSASRLRQREAQNARNNRAEIVRALGAEQITKRDLIRWGIYTTGGMLAMKNGLSPYARSAFAQGATGVPRSPLGNAVKFNSTFERLRWLKPKPMVPTLVPGSWTPDGKPLAHADFVDKSLREPSVKRLSYHTDFTNWQLYNPKYGNASFPTLPDAANPYVNQLTHRGPMEGRPPGEMFSHQRWDEFFPRQGYVVSLSQCKGDTYFHHDLPKQGLDACWCYGEGQGTAGSMPPPLLKLRYGEPVAMRIHNNLPVNKLQNGGFGRNESQLHFHNAHNGAESDGAANVHNFPGTFYDYRWSTTLARRDKINTLATDPRASGPDDTGGLVNVAGDFRELQGTLWAHDHRFFFTAENVYKGNLMMINMYSGKDRGYEGPLGAGFGTSEADGVNLRLPSGTRLPWGNTDFDVNLIVTDGATDIHGQYFFDIFTTDGFVGDMPLVNFQYGPVMNVLPRKYRFRLLNGSMSRFIQLAIAGPTNRAVQFDFIANDGNFVVSPLKLSQLDQQGTGERYDIVIDFSKFKIGEQLHLVNLLQQTDGRKPDKALSMADALAGKSIDPLVGALMRFVVSSQVQSHDDPAYTYNWGVGSTDPSRVPSTLTQQILIEAPVRTRTVEFGRGNGDSRQGGGFGPCTPDCSEVVQDFPWIVKVNGQASHSMNANRISLLYPKPGEIEHWTYINGGGGWDHPIHLHFEEGVTMNRGNDTIPDTEKLVRKDVWRLRPAGQVTFQVQFGEYGGSYVNHCHNTVHEDFAMLLRLQLLGGERTTITATPNPTQDGVIYTAPEILPEGDPRSSSGPTSVSGSGGGGSSGGGGGSSGRQATPSLTGSTTTPTSRIGIDNRGLDLRGGSGGGGHGGRVSRTSSR